MKHSFVLPSTLAAIGLAASVLTSAHGQITWDGNGTANNSGNWSTAVNWDTDVVPTTGNTAVLDVTGANRTVTYDAAASGALGTLTINQTSAFLNQLAVTRSSGLNVSNAITLGATGGGTAEIRIGDLTNNVTATYLTAPSVTVNSGGLFSFQVGGNGTTQNQGSPTFSGNMTIAGGTVGIVAATYTGATSQGNITGNVDMTSGTLRIADATSPSTRDARIQINGNLNATGGTIDGGRAGNQLVLAGGTKTHTIGSGVTIINTPTITLSSNNIILNLDATGTGTILNRSFGAANSTQTTTVKTSSGSGAVSVGRLEFGTSNADNVRSKIVLGSDLTTTYTAGSQPLNAAFGPGSLLNAEYELDLAGRTFDGTSNTAGWTPNVVNAAKGKWFINSSSGNGVAQFVSINTANTNVETSFGANTTLQITGGNSTAINLSTGTNGGGTFDAASSVLYTGNAAIGTPAVLTTNRTIPSFTTRQGFVQINGNLGSSSAIRVGDSSTVGVLSGSAGTALAGVFLNSATSDSNITSWVSGGVNTATAGQGSGRVRIQGTTNTTLNGSLTLATDGGSANTDVRTEIGANTGTTLTIAGAIISAGASNGVIFNGGGAGSGTVKLTNASNNFNSAHGVTISQGTLISGISGAITGAGSQLTLADGAIPSTNTTPVAFLTEGNQTVTQTMDLSNSASNSVALSYTVGVNDASTATFSGGISGRAYQTNNSGRERSLVLTAATGGSATFNGNITQVATDVTNTLNVINVSKTGAGTVTLGGTNSSYTGTTIVTSGTLLAGTNKALGNTSSVTINGGTLDVRGSTAGTLTLGTNAALSLTSGSISLQLGSTFDQIVSSGSGAFTITGGSLALDVTGAGFSYGNSYNVFSGFGGTNSISGLSFTGYDTTSFSASLSTTGNLTFAAVPEPSTWVGAGLIMGLAVWSQRKRFAKVVTA